MSDAEEIARLKARIVTLEMGIKWWYCEKMQFYTDRQYGKAELKVIMNDNPIIEPIP